MKTEASSGWMRYEAGQRGRPKVLDRKIGGIHGYADADAHKLPT